MTREEIILDAIRRANKLGAKGVEVTGYGQSQDGASSPRLFLVTQIPKQITGSGTEWYDK